MTFFQVQSWSLITHPKCASTTSSAFALSRLLPPSLVLLQRVPRPPLGPRTVSTIVAFQIARHLGPPNPSPSTIHMPTTLRLRGNVRMRLAHLNRLTTAGAHVNSLPPSERPRLGILNINPSGMAGAHLNLLPRAERTRPPGLGILNINTSHLNLLPRDERTHPRGLGILNINPVLSRLRVGAQGIQTRGRRVVGDPGCTNHLCILRPMARLMFLAIHSTSRPKVAIPISFRLYVEQSLT